MNPKRPYHNVDDMNPAIPSAPSTMGKYGIFLIMNNAGCIPSTLGIRSIRVSGALAFKGPLVLLTLSFLGSFGPSQF